MSYARSSAEERCSATAEDAGSSPAGRTSGGCSSVGRAPERHSGEARSTRVVRFANPWCNGSTTSSNLVGPGSNPGGFAFTNDRRGPERLGYLSEEGPRACGSTPLRAATHDRDVPLLLGAGADPVIAFEATGRGFESRPELFVLR